MNQDIESGLPVGDGTPRMRTVDEQIDARWVLPIEPAGTLLEHHSVVIDGTRIVDVLPTAHANTRYRPTHRRKLDRHVLMPGLVNAHTHAAMSLLRGFADDLPLMTWLENHIWPAEARHISPEFVYDGSLLACWEMLAGGTTCFNDMYFFPLAAAEAVCAAGIRSVLGITVLEFPGTYARDAADYLEKGLSARATLSGQPLISFALAPHAPYTVSDASFRQIARLASEHGLRIHLHLHETQAEIDGSLGEHDVRPLDRLDRLGLATSGLIGVHAVHLERNEIALLAERDVAVVHCPTSNMKLASGIAPVGALLSAGIAVALGTDGAASNNRLDMFHEMRHAALLAKVATGDAACLPAHTALRMATLDGARALGLAADIGSLIAGKQADLLAVRMDDWMCGPCYDVVSHLVYAVGREHVSHVWVAGKLRINNKKPVDLQVTALHQRQRLWQNRLTTIK